MITIGVYELPAGSDLGFGGNGPVREWVLVKEGAGYIFRDINNTRYGHSGWHKTREEAIKTFEYEGCKILNIATGTRPPKEIKNEVYMEVVG